MKEDETGEEEEGRAEEKKRDEAGAETEGGGRKEGKGGRNWEQGNFVSRRGEKETFLSCHSSDVFSWFQDKGTSGRRFP